MGASCVKQACCGHPPPATLQFALEGDAKKLREELEKGESADATNWRGQTALMCAAAKGHTECLCLLLEKGANPNALAWWSGDEGRPPLMCAVDGGHSECVSALLKNGANVNKRDMRGFTAIHVAVFRNNIEMVKLLLEKGANVLQYSRFFQLERNRENIPFFAGFDEGQTPIHVAADYGRVECLELLLDAGAKQFPHRRYRGVFFIETTSFKDLFSKIPSATPLHFAAFGGHAACISLLLERDAVNPTQLLISLDASGFNATMVAAYMGHAEALECLLSRKTPMYYPNGEVKYVEDLGRNDVLHVNKQLKNAFQLAKERGNTACMELCAKYQPDHGQMTGQKASLIAQKVAAKVLKVAANAV